MNSQVGKSINIEDYLETLKSLALVKDNDNLLTKIESLKEKLVNQNFQLVILGQFKRGKTSLINSLIGADLLPTAIVPLTSIITVLKYGEEKKFTAVFLDSKVKEIKHSELPEYVTETKNPENIKKVERVVIEYPLEFLKTGIEIVDTPGVGSVYKHNSDVAYDFVPKADGGIFVVTADPPISESELNFLKSIKDYLSKIIFVLNKIDQVGEKERLESMEFTRKKVEETVGKKDLFFVQLSAKLALEGKLEKDEHRLLVSNIKNLEEKIKALFIEKKDNLLTLSIVSKLVPLVGEINLSLQVEKKALQMTEVVLKEKTNDFKKEAEKIKKEKEDDSFILQGQAERLAKQVLVEDIENLKEKELPRLTSEFEEFYRKNESLNGDKLKIKMDEFLESYIKSVFNKWRDDEEEKLQDELKNITGKLSDQTNLFIKRIIDLSESIFDLDLKYFKPESYLTEEVEFRFSFDEDQIDLDFTTPLIAKLPKFIANKLLYNKMKDEIVRVFDQHCGRVRYDFHERIMKSLYDYQNSLDEAMEQIISSIEKSLEKVLSEMIKKEEYKDKALQEIENQENILTKISDSLENISTKLNVIV